MPDQLDQAGPAGHQGPLFVGNQASGIECERLFQAGVLVQVRHHRFRVAARLELQHDPQAVFVVRLVADGDQLRQLAALDQLAHRRHQRARRNSVRHRINHQPCRRIGATVAVELPLAADLNAAAPAFVSLAQLAAVGDDAAARAESRGP